MPEPEMHDPKTPQVRDKRTPPPGVLPKNMQAWVVCGIALVMAMVIAFSGRNAPKERASPPASGAAPADPNQARIEEYKKPIEEQSRKLQLEQAQLARNQELLAGAPVAAAMHGPYSSSDGDASLDPSSRKSDKAKRDQESLLASNVALSYRKDQSASLAPAQEASLATAEDALRLLPLFSALAAMQAGTASGAPPKNQTAPNAAHVGLSQKPQGGKREVSERLGEGAGEKKYRLFEGTILETVLTNRLDGSFSGPINCMVTPTFIRGTAGIF
jgi:type IV secretion system protein VirB10